MKITIQSSPKYPRPRAGDKKTVKGVDYVRELECFADGSVNKCGGRYHYVWRQITKVPA